MSPTLRARLLHLALVAGAIVVGFSIHRSGSLLSPVARDVTGDALWAAMILEWTGVLAPAVRLRVRAPAALLFCWAVELTQLYHRPWIDAIRRTTPGHLVLGSDFDPRDLAAYALGIATMMLVERALFKRGSRRDRPG